MRQTTGRAVSVNGRSVHVEVSGRGTDWVVFEAGGGQGRTCWDAVMPLLADRARLVAYDRAGFGRSDRSAHQLSVDDMAADLVALVDAVIPQPAGVVLVAHSMGGLVARRAVESLAPRLRGLLLLDPTPERAPVYDTFDRTAAKIDRAMAVTQALVRFRPLARMVSGNVRRLSYEPPRLRSARPVSHPWRALFGRAPRTACTEWSSPAPLNDTNCNHMHT